MISIKSQSATALFPIQQICKKIPEMKLSPSTNLIKENANNSQSIKRSLSLSPKTIK